VLIEDDVNCALNVFGLVVNELQVLPVLVLYFSLVVRVEDACLYENGGHVLLLPAAKVNFGIVSHHVEIDLVLRGTRVKRTNLFHEHILSILECEGTWLPRQLVFKLLILSLPIVLFKHDTLQGSNKGSQDKPGAHLVAIGRRNKHVVSTNEQINVLGLLVQSLLVL